MDNKNCPPLVDLPPSQEGQPPMLPDKTQPPIKTKCTQLPTSRLILHHPCSLNALPSPTNKWSETSHPIKDAVLGYHNTTILYMHYYFHNGHVLLTQAFAASMTTSTVGDGGHPRLGCILLFALLLRLAPDRHSNLRITRNTAYY
jgi:hypothetical protein